MASERRMGGAYHHGGSDEYGRVSGVHAGKLGGMKAKLSEAPFERGPS